MNYQFNVSFVLSSVREYSDLRPRESERSKNICLAKMAIDVDNNTKKIFKSFTNCQVKCVKYFCKYKRQISL